MARISFLWDEGVTEGMDNHYFSKKLEYFA